MSAEIIRESVIAGSWYPGDPPVLKNQIRGYLDRANPPAVEGQLLGLISPHAGYMYSGGVAAHAYKLLIDNPFDRVLVLAPSHRAHFAGASIYNLGGYRTPLGVVGLDHELIAELFGYGSLFKYVPSADQLEHSLEIQLPFLQTVLPRFSLVPIIVGDQSYGNCRRLADAVAEVCRERRVLLVASTDLSHYFPYEEARRLDGVFIDRVNALDPDGLADDIGKRRCEACGAGPVLTLMLAAKTLGADCAKVLHYANSGDVTGNRSGEVVGYAAAALFRKAHAGRV
jgi:MEMO1 family protein